MKWIVASILAVSCLCMTGCLTDAQRQQIVTAAQEARQVATDARASAEAVRGEVEAMTAELRRAQETDTPESAAQAAALADAIDAKLVEYDRFMAKADVHLDRADEHLERIAKAETNFDLVEAAAYALAGVIPGAGIALPFVRAFRRRYEGERQINEQIVTAVAAGGGPAQPAVTASVMEPEARKRVREIKARTGHVS